MSHHDQSWVATPTRLQLNPDDAQEDHNLGEVKLIIKGQGTISLEAPNRDPFTMDFFDKTGKKGFRLEVKAATALFKELKDGKWTTVARPIKDINWINPGKDRDKRCRYWLSIDCHNRVLRYGKGEMRKNCMLMEYPFPPLKPPVKGKPQRDAYGWVKEVDTVHIAPAIDRPVDIWRDPVTIDPPLRIKKQDAITMDDVATYFATVPENLSLECQQLFANVAGDNFQLNTPDFPEFAWAIEASIADKNGWCRKVLDEKATEFGKEDKDKVYLRITMGVNQGDSPGIPFVMEIWPPGCYSPIHDHAGANAIIKVLWGEISVNLYPMLSKFHTKPFAQASFIEGESTWITPGLNQIHKLHNKNKQGPTCITIQCYQYPTGNDRHYPYFDYIGEDRIGHFVPNSDAGFLEFKEIMRKEWNERKHKTKDSPAAVLKRD